MVNGGCIGFYVPILHGFKAAKVFLKCRRADEFDGGEKRAWNDDDVPFFSSLQKKRREKSFLDYHANLKIGSSMVAAAFVTLQMLNWFFSLDGF